MTRLVAPPRLRNFRPPIADSPDQNSSRSKRALRRVNRDLVNLVSLAVNVHDFLHCGMTVLQESDGIVPRNALFSLVVLILKQCVLIHDRPATDYRSP